MKIKYLIITFLLIGCFEKKVNKDETLVSSIISPDKKVRIDLINSNSNPICKNQPASLWDSGKTKRICFFRIFDNNTNNLLLEINPESDKIQDKELKKCTPENFPLSIAYGFIKFNNNNDIIFEDNYGMYGSSGDFSKIILFNWKNCNFKTLAEFEEGNIGWPDPEGKIYFYSSNNQIYAFLTLKKDKSFRIIKTQEKGKNKYSNFFENEEDELKKEIQILYHEEFDTDEKEFPEWKFNYPYFIAKIKGKELKFNLEQDKFTN
ncbi:hypothetical protein [Leptospira vanthielii]|uniref:Putative lipoprotein n=1 Tax=Leptospira vanthielii serovar Holland str. Waz Holland = ATCC 700522 TaxID=1218591 RepID=N1WEY5_9LEPT|nr:hypothetical protein [Leptospira vanthielii]EMY71950.1 putative lipoprotein [Leptospira vanthielii serovar Holland str. Waz Holland = ATCC 700522]